MFFIICITYCKLNRNLFFFRTSPIINLVGDIHFTTDVVLVDNRNWEEIIDGQKEKLTSFYLKINLTYTTVVPLKNVDAISKYS